MSLKRGSIVFIPFHFTDLSNYKIRPGLVLNTTEQNDLLIAFISKVIPQVVGPADFLITKDTKLFIDSGLKYDSIVKCNKITTLSASLILGELGELPDNVMKTEINKRLKIALGIS